jgi:hypothetical protein
MHSEAQCVRLHAVASFAAFASADMAMARPALRKFAEGVDACALAQTFCTQLLDLQRQVCIDEDETVEAGAAVAVLVDTAALTAVALQYVVASALSMDECNGFSDVLISLVGLADACMRAGARCNSVLQVLLPANPSAVIAPYIAP